MTQQKLVNPLDVVAVPEDLREAAGLIVYWTLSGLVDLQDLAERWKADGMPEDVLPQPPSLEEVLRRAAQAAVPDSRRMFIRPLKARGAWEMVSELVEVNGGGKERLKHTAEITGAVRRDKGCDPVVLLEDVRAGSPVEAHPLLAVIRANVVAYTGTLTVSDISGWLVGCAGQLCAGVPLRDRGGLYFIPRDRIGVWRKVAAAVTAAGPHRCYEIPAMKTAEAVEAILVSVRKETEAAMGEIEAYLAKGEVSTKGKNAYTRAAEEMGQKVEHYAALLGVSLNDMLERLVGLKGAVVAAKLIDRKPER